MQTQAVLELWREAERILRELGPDVSQVDRIALESHIEEIRALYQRSLDQHLRDGEERSASPGTLPDGAAVAAAVESARHRLAEIASRVRPDVRGVLSGDTSLPR